MATIDELKTTAAQVRRDIIRMVHGAKSGHPGGSLGCADFLTALYFDLMELEPESFRVDGAGQDMFFLSNGHITPVLYSVMARRGFFPVKELATFRQLGTRLQGHRGADSRCPHRIRLARTRSLCRYWSRFGQEKQCGQTCGVCFDW